MRTLHFKSKKGFQKWNAYGHTRTKTGLKVASKHGRKSVFESTPGRSRVYIRGKLKKR